MNYRGMPPVPTLAPPAERARGGAVPALQARAGLALNPGAGNWNFNSIESKAKQGLAPTHVPNHSKSRADQRGSHSPAPVTGQSKSRADQRGGPSPAAEPSQTIRPTYKQILHSSPDYQRWLQLKKKFLAAQAAAGANQAGPTNMSDNATSRQEQFPHFPGPDKLVPKRELKTRTTPAPGVYKDGGTLYRKPTAPSRARRPPTMDPRRPTPHTARRPISRPTSRPAAPVVVSSLPATPYRSPLQPGGPPLPPGYELVPVAELTPDHEVVPWEELPGLMRQHNLSLDAIPLGPFRPPTPPPPRPAQPHPATSATPFTAFTPYIPRPTLSPSSGLLAALLAASSGPGLPPPVSPDLHSPALFPGFPPPAPAPTPASRPKAIHFGTHFGSATSVPASATFRYDPTTVPAVDHTPGLPALGRYSPAPTSRPGLSSVSTTRPPFTAFTSTFSPPPTSFTPVTHFYSARPRSTPRYTSPRPEPTGPPSRPQPTRAPTRPGPTPPPPVTRLPLQGQSSPSPLSVRQQGPPPMPKFLTPPNKQLPTYFDVSTPVPPRGPSPSSIKPAAPAPAPIPAPAPAPVPIFQQKAAVPAPTIVFPVNEILPAVAVAAPALVPAPPTGQVPIASPDHAHHIKAIAAFHPGPAVPGQTFGQLTSPQSHTGQVVVGSGREVDRLASVVGEKTTARRPPVTPPQSQLVTRRNPNKMRSSTSRNTEKVAAGPSQLSSRQATQQHNIYFTLFKQNKANI